MVLSFLYDVCLMQGHVQNIYDKLSEKLDAGKVVRHLYQDGAVNRKEHEDIERLSSDLPTRAAQLLLNLVLAQSDDFFNCFLDALIKTNQLDVHQWIVLEGTFCVSQ